MLVSIPAGLSQAAKQCIRPNDSIIHRRCLGILTDSTDVGLCLCAYVFLRRKKNPGWRRRLDSATDTRPSTLFVVFPVAYISCKGKKTRARAWRWYFPQQAVTAKSIRGIDAKRANRLNCARRHFGEVGVAEDSDTPLPHRRIGLGCANPSGAAANSWPPDGPTPARRHANSIDDRGTQQTAPTGTSEANFRDTVPEKVGVAFETKLPRYCSKTNIHYSPVRARGRLFRVAKVLE